MLMFVCMLLDHAAITEIIWLGMEIVYRWAKIRMYLSSKIFKYAPK